MSVVSPIRPTFNPGISGLPQRPANSISRFRSPPPAPRPSTFEQIQDQLDRAQLERFRKSPELEDLRIRRGVNRDLMALDKLKRDNFSEFKRIREVQIEADRLRYGNESAMRQLNRLDDQAAYEANRQRWMKGLKRPRVSPSNLYNDPFRIKTPTEKPWQSLAPGLKFPTRLARVGGGVLQDILGQLLFPDPVADGEIPDELKDRPPEETIDRIPEGMQTTQSGVFYWERRDPFNMARNKSKVFEDQPKNPETFIQFVRVYEFMVSVRSNTPDKEVVYDASQWGYDIIDLISIVGRTVNIHSSTVAQLFERFIFFVPDGVRVPTFEPDGTVQLPDIGIEPVSFSPDYPIEFRPNPVNPKKPDWRYKPTPNYPSVQFEPWNSPNRPPSMKPKEPERKPVPTAPPERVPMPDVQEFPKIDLPGIRNPVFAPEEKWRYPTTTNPPYEPLTEPRRSPTIPIQQPFPITPRMPEPLTVRFPAPYQPRPDLPKRRTDPIRVYQYPEGDEDMPCSECRFNPAVINLIVSNQVGAARLDINSNVQSRTQKVVDDLKAWITSHFQAVVDAFTLPSNGTFKRKRECDDAEIVKAYEGTGFEVVMRGLIAFAGAYLDPLLDKSCSTGSIAIPEWWSVRIGADRPQMVIQWADKDATTGKVGRSRWSTSIPHYSKGKAAINLPDYQKGSYMATVILKDNSKLVINAANKGEADKMIDAITPMIDAAFLPSPLQVQYGERKGQSLSNKTVTATIAQFYSTGQKDTAADFEIECNK